MQAKRIFLIFFYIIFFFTPINLTQAKNTRIVGGDEAVSEAWPWMTALLEKSSDSNNKSINELTFCGGALIHSNWVITAGHCVYEDFRNVYDSEKIELAVGAYDLNEDAKRLKIKRIIVHPQYDYNSDDFDIALIELEEPVSQSPIGVCTESPDDLDGKMATAIGWGKTDENLNNYPSVLRQVEIPVISNEICSEAYNKYPEYQNAITSSMICAGYEKGKKDACDGDSGGPLMIWDKDKSAWKLAGIVSWGVGCAREGLYGVYASVPAMTDFIADYVPLDLNISYPLYFPHVAASGAWDTEICLINPKDKNVTGVLKAYQDSGEELASQNIELPAHGRKQLIVSQSFSDAANIGYMVFESTSSSMTGYLKFYMSGNCRAGLPAVSNADADELYIPHIASNAEWWTGLSVLNTSSEAKSLKIVFNTGDVYSFNLEAGQHLSRTIKDLMGEDISKNIKSGIIQNAEGVLGLELFGSAPKSSTHYLSGVLLKKQTDNIIYYPHIASNAEWWTGLVAYCPSQPFYGLQITPFTQDGTALDVIYEMMSDGLPYVKTGAELKLPSNAAWFKVQCTAPITGLELFGTLDGAQLAGYTGVGLISRQGILPKKSSEDWTGLAFVNVEDKTAALTLTAYTDNGLEAGQAVLDLNSYEKRSKLAEDFFSQNIQKATYIRYSSDKNIVAFQLNGSLDGTMLDGLPVLLVDVP